MNFVNLLMPARLTEPVWEGKAVSSAQVLPVNGFAVLLKGLLTTQQVSELLRIHAKSPDVPVGPDGIKSNYRLGGTVGSYRSSLFSEELALELWRRIRTFEPLLPKSFNEASHADWDGHPAWAPIGVNPLMRFIRYEGGSGHLIAHYDGPYIADEAERSLLSMVLYLTDNPNGGHTRFLADSQDALSFGQRDFSDKPSIGREADVTCKVSPKAGDALLFEHRILHDGEPLGYGPDKLIIRTDIMYRKG